VEVEIGVEVHVTAVRHHMDAAPAKYESGISPTIPVSPSRKALEWSEWNRARV
jgi:hypothetical protein